VVNILASGTFGGLEFSMLTSGISMVYWLACLPLIPSVV
jgi:hypothetical protein